MMNVTQLIDNQYKDYSKYVLYSRAIPHLIDGLKPSQRKILYTALKTAKNGRIKTASLSGNTISTANYHHGDASLNEAITKMVQSHSNNISLLQGEGSFGSRLVPDAAAPRYTYVKMSDNFDKFFADTMVADRAIDPEDPEPAFYLPIIPWVLVNGVKGIAV
ncbi:MAG: DNA topoisomerase, partial [Euryarchaeota archaeon]|nr:DNA topoisomerase [Euryarchaeota archaeon]